MLDELGTRQERLTIGLPVWLTAVAMSYAGVPWLVVLPLGVVGLVLVAGSIGSSANAATWVPVVVAVPLIAGHLVFALPEDTWRLTRSSAPAVSSARAPLPSEVVDAVHGTYAPCSYWAAVEALALDCPTCRIADLRGDRAAELSKLPDNRKCERIFVQTLAHWRGRTDDCPALVREQPRLAREHAGSLACVKEPTASQ